MNKISYAFLIFSVLILGACLPEKDNASIEGEDIPAIKIIDAYGFATLPGASTGAAFMVIKNTSDIDDKLISARSKVASITEIHENMIDPDDGTMMMRKIKSLDLPADEAVTLKPKGYHIMFIKLREPLTIDSEIPLTLNFEKSGSQEVNVKIIAPGMEYKPTEDDHGGHHHHGHSH